MKLLKLQLKNFLSHKDTVLDFEKYSCCLISGENGAGKSAIFDGILWALFGKCRVSDMDALIKTSKNYCQVFLEFEIGETKDETFYYKIKRERWKGKKSKLRLFLWEGKNEWKDVSKRGKLEVEKQIRNLLNINEETFISTVLFSQGKADQFTKKHPTERKKILSEILDLNILENAEKIAKEKSKTLSFSRDLEREELKSLIREIKPKRFKKKLIEEKKLKSKIKEESEFLKKLEKRLRFIERKTRSIEDWEFIKNQYQKFKKEKEEKEEYLNKIKIEFKNVIDIIKKGKKIDFPKKIKKIKSHLNKTKELLKKKTKVYFGLYRNIKILSNFHKHFQNKLKTICPICGTKISTRMKTLKIQRKLEKEIQITKTDYYSVKNQIKDLKRKEKLFIEKLENRANQLQTLENLKSNLKELSNKKTDVELDYWAILKTLSELKEKLNEEKQAGLRLERIRHLEKINETQEKISSLGGELVIVSSDKIDMERKLKRIKHLKNTLIKVSNIQKAYPFLIKSFGKNGLQALIIDNILPDLEEEANKILFILSEEIIFIEFKTLKILKDEREKETLDIWIEDSVGKRLYENYSGGEKMRINLAIRIALSRFLAHKIGIKLNFLLIDEITELDENGVDCFLDLISKLRKEFEKIFVISHLSQLKEGFPEIIEVKKINGRSIIKERLKI